LWLVGNIKIDYKSIIVTNLGLQESDLGYIDLYLIHSPYGGRDAWKGLWRAMVEAKHEGKSYSMGVSNCGVHHLEEIEAYIAELEAEFGKGNGGEIRVGQWELHP
jgi:diketogulonate reductase-like aldo/keto reductase